MEKSVRKSRQNFIFSSGIILFDESLMEAQAQITLSRNGVNLILHEEDIAEVYFSQELEEVEVHHLQTFMELLKEAGGGRKMGVYMSLPYPVAITKEAREFAASEQSQLYTKANAIQVDNLAKRMMFNFFLRINKPKILMKGFADKNSALDWLKKNF